jgi:hypothetical protein
MHIPLESPDQIICCQKSAFLTYLEHASAIFTWCSEHEVSGGEFWSANDMVLLCICAIAALGYLHNAWTNFNRQHSSYVQQQCDADNNNKHVIFGA